MNDNGLQAPILSKSKSQMTATRKSTCVQNFLKFSRKVPVIHLTYASVYKTNSPLRVLLPHKKRGESTAVKAPLRSRHYRS